MCRMQILPNKHLTSRSSSGVDINSRYPKCLDIPKAMTEGAPLYPLPKWQKELVDYSFRNKGYWMRGNLKNRLPL